jgi:hypothetical protein
MRNGGRARPTSAAGHGTVRVTPSAQGSDDGAGCGPLVARGASVVGTKDPSAVPRRQRTEILPPSAVWSRDGVSDADHCEPGPARAESHTLPSSIGVLCAWGVGRVCPSYLGSDFIAAEELPP